MPGPTPGSGELTVLCKVHRRKCMLHAVEGYPARLRHMSRTGAPVEFCESQLFLVRLEYEADRDVVTGELESRDEAAAAAAVEAENAR